MSHDEGKLQQHDEGKIEPHCITLQRTATRYNTLQHAYAKKEPTARHTRGDTGISLRRFFGIFVKHTNICIAYICCICIVYIYILHVYTAFMRYLHICTRGETETNLSRFFRFLVEHTNMNVAYVY